MYVLSPKIKVAEVREVNYVKNSEEKTLHILVVGDETTGITEDIIIPNSRIDLIKDINKGDAITIKLKNERGNFVINSITKEK